MRLSELAAARLEWFRHEQLDGGDGVWSIMVLGKGNKWCEVPLPDRAMDSVQAALMDRDLDIASNDPATPLIAKLSDNAPLSTARIYEVLVHGFRRCAARVATLDPKTAGRIRQASTRWLRHTYGSHSAAKGAAGCPAGQPRA
jgi:site-specific recombinase XerC